MDRRVFEFLKSTDIRCLDKDLQAQVKKCFLDAAMVLCMGTRNPSVKKAEAYVNLVYPGTECTLLSNGKKSSFLGAVLANSTASNALDLDDGFNLTKGHPGAGILGALLAASELTDCSYGEFLSALLVGYELSMRQGLVLQNYYNFYHSTGSYIPFGIAGAVGKLWNENEDTISNAFGIADYYAPFVPCMRTVNEPSDNKDGIYMGAKLGAEAMLLAKNGFTGKNCVINDAEYSDYLDSLGKKYYVFDLYFKFFSCCRWAQGALTSLKKSGVKIDCDQIKNVTVHSYGASGELYGGMPRDEIEAQYNLKYPIACWFLHGDVGPIQSSLGIDSSDKCRELMEKITFVRDEDFEKLFPAKRYSKVVIELKSGEKIETEKSEALGEANQNTSFDEIIEKARRYNAIFNSVEAVDETINAILNTDYAAPFAEVLEKIRTLSVRREGETYDQN